MPVTSALAIHKKAVSIANPFAGFGKKESRLISEEEFAAVYAAADFAAAFDLYLDTSLTITWRDFGIQKPAEIQAAFERFEKCLRDWLTRRMIPMAYIYCHERGQTVGLHTHLNLYVPGHSRREFKNWVDRYAHRCGRGGLKVSAPPTETLWLHWYKFGYLCKGYDRSQIVQHGRNSVDGKVIFLGDLLPVGWRDPGTVELKQRVGCSRSLDRAARQRGIPGYVVDPTDAQKYLSLGGSTVHLPLKKRAPFRSRYEDGCRDVRMLYGTKLYERIAGFRDVDVAERVDDDVERAAKLRDLISGLEI